MRAGKVVTKHKLWTCAWVLVIAAALTPAAQASNFGTSTSISINRLGTGFEGTINSSQAGCKARSVALLRKAPGDSSFSVIGRDTSGVDGVWSIQTRVIHYARYVAAIRPKDLGANGCAGAFSVPTTAKPAFTNIAQGQDDFHGTVSSPATRCVANRTVTLQREESSSFVSIGSDVSSTDGTWSIPTSPLPGIRYQARVAARQVDSVSCMAGISFRITAS